MGWMKANSGKQVNYLYNDVMNWFDLYFVTEIRKKYFDIIPYLLCVCIMDSPDKATKTVHYMYSQMHSFIKKDRSAWLS